MLLAGSNNLFWLVKFICGDLSKFLLLLGSDDCLYDYYSFGLEICLQELCWARDLFLVIYGNTPLCFGLSVYDSIVIGNSYMRLMLTWLFDFLIGIYLLLLYLLLL